MFNKEFKKINPKDFVNIKAGEEIIVDKKGKTDVALRNAYYNNSDRNPHWEVEAKSGVIYTAKDVFVKC